MPVGTLAVPTARRLPVAAPTEDLQVAKRPIDNEHDVGATTAVAAVGPAPRHMGLTAKRDGPVAAGAGLNEDTSAILEHGNQ
jgi:hypothetical protein